MEQIAFVYEQTLIYWSSIIIALSVGAGVCLFWSFQMAHDEGSASTALAIPLAVALSLLLGRLVHWSCRPECYANLYHAMTDYSSGEYALCGAFFGCLLTAVLLRLTGLCKNLPRMLDHMSLAGCAAIALGRLAPLFNAADRGQLLPQNLGFPLGYSVYNTVTGQTEWRLATFALQSIAAGALFVLLLALFCCALRGLRMRSGDLTALFLLYYCACQVLLDSTRNDSLYIRSNGFVSLAQILCAAAIVGVLIWLSVRQVLATRWKPWYPAIYLTLAAAVGFAGYMEYYVQRHGKLAAQTYRNMGLALALMLAVATWQYIDTMRHLGPVWLPAQPLRVPESLEEDAGEQITIEEFLAALPPESVHEEPLPGQLTIADLLPNTQDSAWQ